MKILHINDHYCHLGGAEKYLLDISKTLEEIGHQIIIISSSEGEHISVQGRREYFVKPSHGVRSGLKMWGTYRDIVVKEKPDIIQLHNTHNDRYFISPLIIKKLFRLKPMIRFVHDARFFCPNYGIKVTPFSNEICNHPVGSYCLNRKGCHLFNLNRDGAFYNLYRYFLVSYELSVSRLFDKIIVGSEYMYDELVRNGFSRDKIEKIPCYTEKAIDCEKVNNKKKWLILCVSRVQEGKGVTEFIESLNYIKDKQWEAEIVGDGNLFIEMQKKVEALGLKERIKFLGRLSNEEINDCYQGCSIVVVPSMSPESFGLVGIEAMAFGKPVVAFDSGGIKEWLVNGETGFLIERGDIKGMAHGISKLLEDEELARKMGAGGMERVKEFFGKDLHTRRLLTVYEKVIKKRENTEIL